jgi:nicotinate-nucleotide pyrophosphorylase (carboxylating)
VEVENLGQLREAIGAAADIAMLDNFSLQDMRAGVAMNAAAPRPLKIEASGGVDMESIRAIAQTGVDFISVGGITKHVHAVDLSMRFEWGA